MTGLISDLPNEMLAEIISFLHSKFIVMMASRVCKKWHFASSFVKLRLKITTKEHYSHLNQSFGIGRNYYFSISTLSVRNCKLSDQDIEQLCLSEALGSSVEYLILRGNEFGSKGLKLVVDSFNKLRSLDIRDVNVGDGYHYLMNSRVKLPALVDLKVGIAFNHQIEQSELSIKQQLRSLTLHYYVRLYGYDKYTNITCLGFENLTELKLTGVQFNSSILPANLKAFNISNCFIEITELAFVENLEELHVDKSEISGFPALLKGNLQQLKRLTLSGLRNSSWEDFENCTEWKPLNLVSLDISDNEVVLKNLSKICNFEGLTCLNISGNTVHAASFIEDCGSKWKNLTRLDSSNNFLSGEVIKQVAGIPSLKHINVSNSNSMKDEDRRVLCALSAKTYYMNCSPFTPKYEFEIDTSVDSYTNFLESLSRDVSTPIEYSKSSGSSIRSFDLAKYLKISVKSIGGLTDRHTMYKSHYNLSFSIDCELVCRGTKERKCTRAIPHTGADSLEWNEEITFNSLISEFSCDYIIEFTLICDIMNNISGISKRESLLEGECPVFNSHLELHQGHVKLFLKEKLSDGLRVDVSLDLSFEIYGYTVKYDIESEPPLKFKTLLQEYEEQSKTESITHWIDTTKNLKDPEKMTSFLCSIPLDNPFAIYIAAKYVSKWKKPTIFHLLPLLNGTQTKSLFVRSIVVEILEKCSDDQLSIMLPYLTHCLKFDMVNSSLSELLIKRALKSNLIGNQIFWMLKMESHYYAVCRDILLKYFLLMNSDQREIIQNQCVLLDSLQDIVCKSVGDINIQKPLLIPCTKYEVEKLTSYSQVHGVVTATLMLKKGDSIVVSYSHVTRRPSFVMNSFTNVAKNCWLKEYKLPISSFRSIETYPTSPSKGFTLIPTSFSKVSRKLPFSDLTLSKSNSFKDTLLLTAAYDAFIGFVFKNQHPTYPWVDKTGVFVRQEYSPKMTRRILGLVIRMEGLVFPELEEHVKNNNLHDALQKLILGFSKSFTKNLDLITGYMKPFIEPIPNDYREIHLIDVSSRLSESVLLTELNKCH